jgi:hypothetical protein
MAEEIAHTHYIARIVIERVNHMQEPAKSHVHNSEPTPTGRKVTELATITLRNDELDRLVDRVTQHLGLIEDIEAIDDQRKGLRGSGMDPQPKYRDR